MISMIGLFEGTKISELNIYLVVKREILYLTLRYLIELVKFIRNALIEFRWSIFVTPYVVTLVENTRLNEFNLSPRYKPLSETSMINFKVVY